MSYGLASYNPVSYKSSQEVKEAFDYVMKKAKEYEITLDEYVKSGMLQQLFTALITAEPKEDKPTELLGDLIKSMTAVMAKENDKKELTDEKD